jgi:hypothetical protein
MLHLYAALAEKCRSLWSPLADKSTAVRREPFTA